MNHRRIVALLFYLYSAASTAATAIVMDFEGVVNSDGAALFQSPYSEGALTLTHSGGAGEGIFGSNFVTPFPGGSVPSNTNSNGSSVFGWCAAEAQFTGCANAQLDLSVSALYPSFQLVSLDLSNLNNYDASVTTGAFSIIGQFAAGGTIAQTYEFTLDTWDTVTFDNSWAGLSSVSVRAINVPSFDAAIDNISVVAVPVPATFWLLGSAMVGLGSLRRKPVA